MGLATCATGFMDMQGSDLAEYQANVEAAAANITMPMIRKLSKIGGDITITTGWGRLLHAGETHNDAAEEMKHSMESPFYGYNYQTDQSRLAGAASVLLIALGVATFAAIKFLPRKNHPSVDNAAMN